MQEARLEKTWPGKEARKTIIPIFLPFAGCRGRCLFCAQEAQTGMSRPRNLADIEARLKQCAEELVRRREAGKSPPQLAFYGGTFTALPPRAWEACLAFAQGALDKGLADGFRCSTRPDSLHDGRLRALRQAGCTLVELGAQSFCEEALERTSRGYGKRECMAGCKAVVDAGLALCVHLMPGLPGGGREDFFRDVELALRLGAKAFRFSPCLVLEGSALAELWRDGLYRPWDLDTALDALAAAWLRVTEAGATVIRLGLAPQEELKAAVLAGPVHECLGSRVSGRALLLACVDLKRRLEKEARLAPGKCRCELHAPRQCGGYIWGWRGELVPRWHELGFDSDNIFFHARSALEIRGILEPGSHSTNECQTPVWR